MNKNTKRIRAIVRKDGKDGNHETILLVPAKDYHNNQKGEFVTRRIPTAIRGAKGIVSSNSRRNAAMVVSINEDAHGRKDSRTTHEILAVGKFANPKNKRRSYASATDANKR